MKTPKKKKKQLRKLQKQIRWFEAETNKLDRETRDYRKFEKVAKKILCSNETPQVKVEAILNMLFQLNGKLTSDTLLFNHGIVESERIGFVNLIE